METKPYIFSKRCYIIIFVFPADAETTMMISTFISLATWFKFNVWWYLYWTFILNTSFRVKIITWYFSGNMTSSIYTMSKRKITVGDVTIIKEQYGWQICFKSMVLKSSISTKWKLCRQESKQFRVMKNKRESHLSGNQCDNIMAKTVNVSYQPLSQLRVQTIWFLLDSLHPHVSLW